MVIFEVDALNVLAVFFLYQWNVIPTGLITSTVVTTIPGDGHKYLIFWLALPFLEVHHACLGVRVGLEKVFRHTNTPDEVFLATLIWDSPFRERLFDPLEHVQNQDIYNTANLRFIDWTRGKSIRHPWTFTLDDKDLLLGLPHFWARKFDERVDTRIIDYFCDALKTKD